VQVQLLLRRPSVPPPLLISAQVCLIQIQARINPGATQFSNQLVIHC
jgi:hypothetical protein